MIYVIGSLRNPQIVEVGNALREDGFEVFDEWHAGGKEADDEWQRYEKQRGRTYHQALKGHHAHHTFQHDLFHLNRARGGLLVLPAGKSGHMEFGYIVGQGKPGFVLADKAEPDRFDLMTQFATSISSTVDEVRAEVKAYPWPKWKVPSIYTLDAIWLAALLEGEGSFTCQVVSEYNIRPRITLNMTDKDVVDRAAKLFGAPLWGPYSKQAPRKDVWATAVAGWHAAEWMRILQPYLGKRRQAKVSEILGVWGQRKKRIGRPAAPKPVAVLAPWSSDL